MRALARILACLAALFGLASAYGYWQAVSNGYLEISMYDRAGATANRRYADVERATIALRNRAGQVIGEGRIEPPWSYIRWHYSGYASCEAIEKASTHSSESRAQWGRCVAAFYRWYRETGEAARSFDARWNGCSVSNVPLQLAADRGDWMLWWVPLPHAGGTPHTTYSARLVLDRRDCSARAEPR